MMLLAGGGVRGEWDIERLADVGCDGALVGTALLSGDVKGPGIAKGDDLRRLARIEIVDRVGRTPRPAEAHVRVTRQVAD